RPRRSRRQPGTRWWSRFPRSLCAHLRDLADLERLGLLCRVRVLRPRVHLQLLGLRPTELVLRQHALDDLLHQALRLGVQQLAEGPLAQTTRVTAVPVGQLLVALVAGQDDLLRVDDDDVITTVHVRGVRWLVLAAQQGRDLGRQAAE